MSHGEVSPGPNASRRGSSSIWEELLSGLKILEVNPEVCWRYARLHRFLKDNGQLIGANDLWIAATAVTHGTALVTRNERHFRRIPELRLLGYAS